MQLKLLQWLACPACGDGSFSVDVTAQDRVPVWSGHREPGEDLPGLERDRVRVVREGTLFCQDCGARFPVREGIPRLLPPGGPAGPSTGHRLTEFEGAVPEYEENFLDLIQPVSPADFVGRLVLDAGCGFGRHAWYAARYGAEVVAMDSSEEAVASAARNLRECFRAHVIQGDVHRPPLRKGVFDLVYCLGVLHHVEKATVAFRALDELVKPTGRLSVWVYGPRQGLTRIATGALHGATSEMSPAQLRRFSQVLAGVLRVVSHTPHRALGKIPILSDIVTHLPVHDHSRWPFETVVADIYDRLRVPVTDYFMGEEIERWYADAGYADIRVSRRVRNTESFRATGVRR